MQSRLAAGTVQDGRFKIVENNLSWAAAKEFQCMDQRAIEFAFALRDRTRCDAAGCKAQRPPTETVWEQLSPAHNRPNPLAWPARIVIHFLVDASASGSDLPQVLPHHGGLATVWLVPLANLLQHTHCGQFRVFGDQVDLGFVGIENAAP